MSLIYCPRCHNKLGELIGEYMAIRHKGRELVAHQVLVIRCEECGQTWTPGGCPDESPRGCHERDAES